MITYIVPFESFPEMRLPKLHSAIASPLADEYDMRRWCKQHCVAPYYFYPSWTGKNGAQFEDSEDAIQFALVWG